MSIQIYSSLLALSIGIHLILIGFSLRQARINTCRYHKWQDKAFLRFRHLNIALILWSLFWMSWAIFWIARDAA